MALPSASFAAGLISIPVGIPPSKPGKLYCFSCAAREAVNAPKPHTDKAIALLKFIFTPPQDPPHSSTSSPEPVCEKVMASAVPKACGFIATVFMILKIEYFFYLLIGVGSCLQI
jgi:hypothetical protein